MLSHWNPHQIPQPPELQDNKATMFYATEPICYYSNRKLTDPMGNQITMHQGASSHCPIGRPWTLDVDKDSNCSLVQLDPSIFFTVDDPTKETEIVKSGN